ncbi:MAG: signal peptidase II [Alphaproteobacteria bacterium]|nr:signal peptidase II [Alphaproteobacteria bacterium]MBV9370629.1 signal peptidase II [Alphaproteobacteria bacterium]MBV9900007.1 signal peptidase II [Alphaproteobacteria bacterium]
MAEAVEGEATASPPAVPDRVRRNRVLGLSVALAVFAVDQASKWIVTYILQLEARQKIELLPIFELRWVPNPGVSMGFLTAGSHLGRWALVAMTAAIAIFVATWLWRERRRDDALALALVLGGAMGNILDRVRLGHVVDFAHLHFGDISPFLVFNVGDAAITIGVLLLLVRALLTRDRKTPLEDK